MLQESEKLNIIIFEGSFETTTFIRRLMQGLEKLGHRVTLIGFQELNRYPVKGIYYQSLGSNQSKLKLILTSFIAAFKYGTLEHVFKAIKFTVRGKRKQLQSQNLEMILKALCPDIIHVQWSSLLPWVEPYLENSSFKVILSQRGFHVNVRPFVNPENMTYLQKIYPKLDGLHSVSHAISKKSKILGIPKKGLDVVVYTGIDLNTLVYKTKAKQKGVLKLLSVGRPHWIKDYVTAINACAQLKAEGVDFHYTIIGGAGHEELLFLIHHLGLKTNITLIGRISQDAVYKQMRDTDLLLLTSQEEGLPNVVVEAMALGTPVISTNCGGISELINHNVNGWLVPVAETKFIVKAIKEVITFNEEQLNKVTMAAREKVEEQHNIIENIKRMENFYNHVCIDNKPLN